MAIFPAVSLLAIVQAIPTATGLPSSATIAPSDHVAACAPAPAEDGDIVVCGRKDRDEQYRLHQLTHAYDPVPGPGVGFRVGAGRANTYITQQKSPDGKPDKRIVMTLTLPF